MLKSKSKKNQKKLCNFDCATLVHCRKHHPKSNPQVTTHVGQTTRELPAGFRYSTLTTNSLAAQPRKVSINSLLAQIRQSIKTVTGSAGQKSVVYVTAYAHRSTVT